MMNKLFFLLFYTMAIPYVIYFFFNDQIILTDIHANISSIGLVILTIGTFKKWKELSGKFFVFSFLFLLSADFLYARTILLENRINSNTALFSELCYSGFMGCFLGYLLTSTISLFKNRTSLIITALIFIVFILLNTVYVHIPFFEIWRSGNKYENIIYISNTLIYTFLESAVLGIIIPLTLRCVKLHETLFLLFPTLMIVSDFAIRFQSNFLDKTGAFSPNNVDRLFALEHGWAIGTAGMFAIVLINKALPLFIKENFIGYKSIRVLLATTIIVSTGLIVASMYLLNILNIDNAFILTKFLLVVYVSWVTSNLISLHISKRFISLGNDITRTKIDFKTEALPLNTLCEIRSTSSFYEIDSFFSSYNGVIVSANLLMEKISKSIKTLTMAETARQVSHDIRSPLAALNMTIRGCLNNISEEERVIIRSQIQRIQDIANNLLTNSKNESQKVDTTIKEVLIAACIDELVTDKRLEFRQFLSLNIEAELYNSYGFFAKVNITDFKRILSNLINNSKEAFNNNSGSIKLSLEDRESDLAIIVSDNGKGIPKEVIQKLGEEGVSFGKKKNSESGSGIGLSSAIKTIKAWGGEIKIESEVNVGTRMIILLPKSPTPDWFVSEIILIKNSCVVILDDDQGIHHTWDQKFLSLGFDKLQIEVVHLSTPTGFREWINTHSRESMLCLCDFELLGFKENGLDLIEEMKIANRAILVTSRYDEEIVRKRCEKLKIKLIPKMMAGLVPITIKAEPARNTDPSTTFDFIYIDDDKLLLRGWEREAKKVGAKLLTLTSPHEFNQYEHLLSKENCQIYIDRELGDEFPKGEDFAISLRDKGFKNLFLATGHDPKDFEHLSSWLKCTGKESPWETDDNYTE
ncbi:MAG: HAMP domain-containing histidine kinase [Oligoflexia bacterium]|nr:HAMP domain-containing histidine kinase [Oligoflexia bacterium]MBF0364642.1 HAMP domain-containing histidine kinase [Oligoflexia bacterium]